MKLFHISDLHIGKFLHQYNLKEDQEYILDQIVDQMKANQIDTLLISGDIYDKVIPSGEAVTIFDDFLTKIHIELPEVAVLLISGNHDSKERLDYANRILAHHQIYIAGMAPMDKKEPMKKVVLEDQYGKVNLYLLPFIKPGHVKHLFDEPLESYEDAVQAMIEREQIDYHQRTILLSHQYYTASGCVTERSDSETLQIGGLDQIDAKILEGFDYVALGHIHRGQKVGKETVRYSGTPLAYSVSEASQQKTITMITLFEKNKAPLIEMIPLKPLHPVLKKTGTLEDLLANATAEEQEAYISLTLTDEKELFHPKEQLEQVYHRILEVRVDQKQMQHIFDEHLMSEEEPEENLQEAFAHFFKEVTGQAMTEEEQQLIQELIIETTGGEE